MTELLSHNSNGYDATPSVHVSPQVTKMLVYGLKSGAASTSFFYIDFTTATLRDLTFPAYSIFDPANLKIILEEDWMYVRQLQSGLQTISGGNQ